MPQSPDIRQNSDRCISNFQISGQSLIKVNCHNSRTSDDMEENLGPVIKLDMKNKKMSKKNDDDIMSANGGVIVNFSNLQPIWCNGEAGFRTHHL